MRFVDIHSHKSRNSDAFQLLDLSDEIDTCTSMQNPYSLGIHPWYVKESMLEQDLESIENHIQTKSFLAIGECGLDKVCDTVMALQYLAFEKQIHFSEKYKKPLIVHVVKAFNELIHLRLSTKSKQVWIVHGFNGSSQLAKQLVGLGMYISFGPQLKNKNSKASKTIASVPLHRVFFETDDSDLKIEDIYAIASERLKIDIDPLKKRLWQNFQVVFR